LAQVNGNLSFEYFAVHRGLVGSVLRPDSNKLNFAGELQASQNLICSEQKIERFYSATGTNVSRETFLRKKCPYKAIPVSKSEQSISFFTKTCRQNLTNSSELQKPFRS
jgi:hypothetical protein